MRATQPARHRRDGRAVCWKRLHERRSGGRALQHPAGDRPGGREALARTGRAVAVEGASRAAPRPRSRPSGLAALAAYDSEDSDEPPPQKKHRPEKICLAMLTAAGAGGCANVRILTTSRMCRSAASSPSRAGVGGGAGATRTGRGRVPARRARGRCSRSCYGTTWPPRPRWRCSSGRRCSTRPTRVTLSV